MRIDDIPLHDRPRERLATRGAQALSERELVAIVLSTGDPARARLIQTRERTQQDLAVNHNPDTRP